MENLSLNGSQSAIEEINNLYNNHAEMPYISPERDLDKWLKKVRIGNESLVPKRNTVRTDEGLLPGDIILLWRIQFGTFTTETWYPKYFEYDYGIDAPQSLKDMIDQDYAYQESAYDSMDHVTAASLKNILKAEGVTGYSSLKKDQLVDLVKDHVFEETLGDYFDVRGIALTDKGVAAVENNPSVIDKHPKKNL